MTTTKMSKSRLEAFSDGVLAVAITIMVLEIKVPHGQDFSSLIPLYPKFLSYLLSFIYIGIYWNNHHHMLQVSQKVNGRILWANHHLLFWLTLIPFSTGWMGENHFAPASIVAYGFVLLMCAIAYVILQQSIISAEGESSILKKAIASDWKGKVSPACYILAMALAYFLPWISMGLYLIVALIWLVPDTRIEKIYSEA
jgi:uncharacterized membrane protein